MTGSLCWVDDKSNGPWLNRYSFRTGAYGIHIDDEKGVDPACVEDPIAG